jgi:UDP-N-acetylmuramate dehydrogenase
MILQEHTSLKPFNTFGIDAESLYFTELADENDLCELLQSGLLQQHSFFILGGGSNVIFRQDYKGIIVKIGLHGIEKVNEDKQTIWLKAAAGENWSDFVEYCISQGWGGVENLTAIPGTVGASPVQNVGAYGTEAKDVIDTVEAYEIITGCKRLFTNAECRFDYRDSIFKNELKHQYIITSVTFRLQKEPELQLNYGAIQSQLNKENILSPSIADVSRVITRLRETKLPDPSKIGSAGSFFKNPVVSAEQYQTLKQTYPAMVAYPHHEGYKLAAGWLIEQCGWKGKQLGHVGVYPLQALVLVNLGDCTGTEVFSLASEIQQSVQNTFGVELETEAIFV